MSKIADRNDPSVLRVLLSQQTISRRGLLLSSLAGAAGLTLTGIGRRAMAAEGSLRSLTYSGQRWGMVQEGMAPPFTQASGFEAEIVTFPISQGYARILTALGIGSSEYDVIDLDYGILAQVANKLEPLDAFLQSDSAYAADYESSVPANVRGLYQFDGARLGQGTTYGIANDSNTQLGFYRADVFEKAGITAPPATWDEVLAVAKELTVDTPAGKQYGFTTNGKRGIFSSTLFGQMLFSYGGNWLDENNAPTLTTPEAEQALSMIEQLMPYADPSVVNAGDNETINAMASGVAVYAPNAWGNNAFTNPQLNELAEVTKAVIVPRGAVPSGRNSPLMGGFGLVIPAAAENKEAAWKFIQYLTGKDHMKAYVDLSGQPARVDALKEYASTAPIFSALADSLPNGVYQPGWLRDQSGFYQALGTQVSLVMTGQKSVGEALQQAQEDCTAVLKKSGDMKS
jgi:ABC-type glycerol-3-phosphate transport system substrate-binding protein